MTIKDKYYNDRNVDYNGNNLTIEVGSFLVDGNLTVSGDIVGGEQSGVDLNTEEDLHITGNANWFFDNDNKNIFIFNDIYKKFAIGFDVEGRSVSFDSDFRDNPTFFFSGTSDFQNYGTATGSKYIAKFENYSNAVGCSGVLISLNRSNSGITETNDFLRFQGHDGFSSVACGTISGIGSSEGITIRGHTGLVLTGDDITVDSDNFTVDSDNFTVDSATGVFQASFDRFSLDSSGSNLDNGIRLGSNYDGSSNFVVTTIATGQRVSTRVKFLSFVDEVGECGSIRGAPPSDSSSGSFAIVGQKLGGDTKYVSGVYAGIDGGVSFRSFGGDFGEIFIMGNESEWEFDESTSLAEGVLVYAYENKFYRFNDSGRIPMIVSHRAAFVGNDFNSDERSECLSLIGQVHVFVEGKCLHGDYLIPKYNHCIAISSKDITFEEYKMAIGVALESKNSEEISRINCLVGKK